MSPAKVLAKHRYAKAACDGCCKSYGYPDRHAAHQIDALRAAGFSVVRTPVGEHDPFDILCAVNRGEATKADAICPRCRPAAAAEVS